MIFRLKQATTPSMVRPRVTPDPERAAELQRRISALNYHPENEFHRDRQQHRRAPVLRLVAQR